MTNNSQDEKISYLAGIFDGEGHIGIKRQTSTPQIFYTGRAAIEMTNDEPVTMFKEEWGGNIHQKILKSGKISYYYYVPTHKLEDFLLKMTPHLKVKNKQAITLMKFLHLRKQFPRKGGFSVSDECHQKQHQLYSIIRTLNA